MAISALWSFRQNMDYTVRITAAVFFQSGSGNWLVKTYEKRQKKNVKNDGNREFNLTHILICNKILMNDSCEMNTSLGNYNLIKRRIRYA